MKRGHQWGRRALSPKATTRVFRSRKVPTQSHVLKLVPQASPSPEQALPKLPVSLGSLTPSVRTIASPDLRGEHRGRQGRTASLSARSSPLASRPCRWDDDHPAGVSRASFYRLLGLSPPGCLPPPPSTTAEFWSARNPPHASSSVLMC